RWRRESADAFHWSLPVTTKSLWQGVYPAATTQFAADFSLDLPACRRTVTALVDDGVDGLVLLGTVGENNSLRPEEKRTALVAAVEAVGGGVPFVWSGSELSTRRRARSVGCRRLRALD